MGFGWHVISGATQQYGTRKVYASYLLFPPTGDR